MVVLDMHVVCTVQVSPANDALMITFLDGLRSWQLFVLAAALLVIDLLVPDPIPFLDETLLAVLTYTLARWKKPAA